MKVAQKNNSFRQNHLFNQSSTRNWAASLIFFKTFFQKSSNKKTDFFIILSNKKTDFFFIFYLEINLSISSLALFLWEMNVALHRLNSISFHWKRPSCFAIAFFFLSCFLGGNCQNADPRSRIVKNLASPNFERLSSILGIGQASFALTEFRYRKSQQNFK